MTPDKFSKRSRSSRDKEKEFAKHKKDKSHGDVRSSRSSRSNSSDADDKSKENTSIVNSGTDYFDPFYRPVGKKKPEITLEEPEIRKPIKLRIDTKLLQQSTQSENSEDEDNDSKRKSRRKKSKEDKGSKSKKKKSKKHRASRSPNEKGDYSPDEDSSRRSSAERKEPVFEPALPPEKVLVDVTALPGMYPLTNT